MSLCIFEARFWGFFSVMVISVVASNFYTVGDSKKSQNVPERNGHPFLSGFEMDYDQTQTSCV